MALKTRARRPPTLMLLSLAITDNVPAVFVAIVNYRTGPMLVACLASLASQVPLLRGGRVIVDDNASGDDSVAHISGAIDANAWGGWCEVIALPRNGGFAYGNNRAIERAQQLDPALAAMLFLNPDTVVRPGFLRALLSHLDSHSQAGIVGASIEDEHGARQRTAHPFPSPLTEFVDGSQLGIAGRLLGLGAMSEPAQDRSHACDWVSGACFAVRRQVFERIGLLDEGLLPVFRGSRLLPARTARRLGAGTSRTRGSSITRVVDRNSRSRAAPAGLLVRVTTALFHQGVRNDRLIAADLLWAIGRAKLPRAASHRPSAERRRSRSRTASGSICSSAMRKPCCAAICAPRRRFRRASRRCLDRHAGRGFRRQARRLRRDRPQRGER
jgi:hypothetical protein